MRKLTLSFDNGPEPGITDRVLDLLSARGIRTTFFVIGRKVADPAARGLSQRARAEGHWIGNHSMTHTTPLGELPAAEAIAEIDRAQAALGDLVHPDRLFRPFGRKGRLGPHLLHRAAADRLQEDGYTCVTWNSIPRDWEPGSDWVDRALSDIAAQDWTLVVLHDTPTGAIDGLERFLDAVGAADVEIVQEMPPSCVHIHRGMPRDSLAAIVT